MTPLILLISYDVIEFLETLRRKDQLALRRRFIQIASFPDQYSDYSEPDDNGRPLEIHIFGRYAIKYWIDISDRHLKILDVHFADRRR